MNGYTILLLLMIFLLVIIFFVVIEFFVIMTMAKADPYEATSKWTKAICNEDNYCIDVIITCNENEMIDVKPVNGGVYFPEDWIDPRPRDILEKWC